MTSFSLRDQIRRPVRASGRPAPACRPTSPRGSSPRRRARGPPWSRASAAPHPQRVSGPCRESRVASRCPDGAWRTSGHPDHMRAIWKGAVSFGLVSVPVKLYSATESKDISFRQVHAKDGGRIKYQRICSIDGEEVEYADIAKGYETEDGEMVILTDEDMAQLPADSSREISVEKFVPQRADRPDALREVLLPRAREDRRQALRAAARGARGRRPDGPGDGLAAQPDVAGRAPGARRRDRDADDDVARRDPQARLRLRRHQRGQAGRGEDGHDAGRDPRRRLRRPTSTRTTTAVPSRPW